MNPAAPVTRMGGTDIYLPFNSQPPQIDDGRLALAIEPRLHVEDDAFAVLQEAGHEIPSAAHIFLVGDRKDDGPPAPERTAGNSISSAPPRARRRCRCRAHGRSPRARS